MPKALTVATTLRGVKPSKGIRSEMSKRKGRSYQLHPIHGNTMICEPLIRNLRIPHFIDSVKSGGKIPEKTWTIILFCVLHYGMCIKFAQNGEIATIKRLCFSMLWVEAIYFIGVLYLLHYL